MSHIRVRYAVLGGHVHCGVWSTEGDAGTTHGRNGTLIFRQAEFDTFREIMLGSPDRVEFCNDEESNDEWRCAACGSDRWVAASLTGPVGYGGRAIRQCVPCGRYSNDPIPEPSTKEEPCSTGGAPSPPSP